MHRDWRKWGLIADIRHQECIGKTPRGSFTPNWGLSFMFTPTFCTLWLLLEQLWYRGNACILGWEAFHRRTFSFTLLSCHTPQTSRTCTQALKIGDVTHVFLIARLTSQNDQADYHIQNTEHQLTAFALSRHHGMERSFKAPGYSAWGLNWAKQQGADNQLVSKQVWRQVHLAHPSKLMAQHLMLYFWISSWLRTWQHRHRYFQLDRLLCIWATLSKH